MYSITKYKSTTKNKIIKFGMKTTIYIYILIKYNLKEE